MTGTPLDLTPFGSVLEGIGLLYWAVVLAAVGLVAWKARGWALKLLGCTAVLAVLVLPVALHALDRQRQIDAAKARLAAATAHFEMRCRGAGERIHRTVEGVDGVVLLNLRPSDLNFGDQFRLNDPYGQDCAAESCISQYLFDARLTPAAAGLTPANRRVYQFVEAQIRTGGERLRFRQLSPQAPMTSEPVTATSATYGVRWEDISTREDRQHWVAGGRLVIVDLTNDSTVAERTGYLIDLGQGDTTGFRSPWTAARSKDTACPSVRLHNVAFVEKVLRPTKGE